MKLHLPLSLYKSLLVLMSACAVTSTSVQAGLMHQDVAIQVYTDFGQNKGRYVTSAHANELVQFIRTRESGIAIPYTDGSAPFYISNEQGMINFSGTGDNGAYAAIAPNAMVTVEHNGPNDASYGEREVGSEHAINYSAIDISGSSVFRLVPVQDNGDLYDYMMQRQSKIVTDAVYNPLTGVNDVSTFEGQYLYHSGAGSMGVYEEGFGYSSLGAAYAYIIGGINTITDVQNGSGNNSVISAPGYGDGRGACQENPLPNGIQGGDSGSPVYVYNGATGSYEYVAAQQSGYKSGGNGWSQARGNVQWTRDTLESFNSRVTMSPTTSTVYLNAVSTQGEIVTDAKDNTTTKWLGTVTGKGMETVSFVGIKSGLNTWGDLSAAKNLQNWYAYDSNAYLQRSDAELFFSNNLVFSSNAAENTIELKDTVDLGIGYAEFNGGKFTITSEGGESNQFNHAGYVINEGAEVHLKLVNKDDYMTEWRKTGAGALYIDGTGNTNALLNVGGSGTTYLQQTGGYAAYNVLVNSGATVEIADTEQIKRDFTFGAGGGVLNMNGKSMDWYTTAEAADSTRAGFSINALTEDALVANYSGSSTLTYKESGDTTYAGSFADSADSSLKIVYDVAKGSWTLNSIRTNLQHEDSGLQVDAGRVILSGTNTVHGTGSATGRNKDRYFHEDDWHYADAKMEVSVTDGGTFELGSHARLTGDVTVESGGTYVMREGVRHTMEYVEGGQVLEDTGKYAAYFGHKGDVVLNGGTFAVQFNDGVDATTAYNGAVKGTGAMTVDAGGDGGIFSFGGKVDATVSKTLKSGQLQLTGTAAADTANKWLVEGGGAIIQFDNVYDTLGVIDEESTGVIALKSGSYKESFDFSESHRSLGIGAQAGAVVQYGSQEAELAAVDREWRLGGGGGELQVHYKLTGNNALVAGSGESASGVLSLLNPDNDFTGNVSVQGIMLKMGLMQNQIELKKGHLNILDALSGTYEAQNISGTGALSLNFTDAMESNELALHEGLSVDVHLQSGAVSYKKSTMSGNWELSGGVKLRLAENVALSQDLDLNVSGKAELHGDRGLTIGNGVLRGSGELVNALTGTVAIADMSELACFTQDSAAGSAEIQGGHAQKVTVNRGTLTLAQSVTVDEVLVNGGNLYINANNANEYKKRLSGDITITGGVLKFNSAGTSDTLNYAARGCSISVGNGTLDFGETRQTMGGWTIVMSDGGVITGEGGKYGANNAFNAALDFNQNNSTIYATDGESTISSVTRLRAADQNINLNYDVAEGASLTVSGLIHADNNTDNRGSITKKGKGTLVYGVQHTYAGTTTIEDGRLVLNSGAYELKNKVSGAGVLEIAGDTTCSINTGIKVESNITVDSKASLVFNGSDPDSLGSVSRNLVVDGGSVNFGTTRQTMYSWNVYLSDGAEITGEGGDYTVNGAHKAALDYNYNNSTIYVTSGTENSISAVTRLRSKNGQNQNQSVNLNYDVSEGAKLTVSGKIHADDVAGLGSITKEGKGVLELAMANTYADTTTVNGGILQVSTDGALGSSALVINDGAEARIGASRTLKGHTTVNTGGRLSFTSTNAIEHGDWGLYNRNLTVDGGVVDFGSTWQTIANWVITLRNGAEITGEGGSYGENNAFNAALDFNNNNSTIYVTSGTNTISASTRLRNGNNLIYDVAQGATLDVSGQVHADDAASKGSITKSGAGTLILSNGTNSYADTTTVNGGILQVSTAKALGSSALVINDGAEARIGASRTLKGDTTVNAGGRLTFTSTDTIEYGNAEAYSRNLTVDGGTLDFGGTRQTMAKWNLTLKNGATVAGTGGAYNGSAYTAALDFNQNSTIKAEGVGNIISANVRLRGGNNRTLTYQVAEGADLEVSGRMHADTTGALGNVTKSGSGKLVLSSQTRLNLLNTEAGEVVLAYNGADGNILEGLDGAMNRGTTALGVLRLAEKVKLTVTNIWSRAVTGIYLENGAEMTLSGHDLVVTGTGMGTARFGVIESDGKKYAKDSIDYELRNGHMKSTADADTSVANRLTYASVENAGSGKLAVTNSANTLTGVVASGGDVSLQNLAAAVSLDVLEVAAGKTVGVYTGAEAGNTQAVTVRDSLILEAGAGLNMVSLTLAEGATLEMTGLDAGAVNLSGALTFGPGLKMGESLLVSVGALDYGETLNLFTGLSGVNLPVVVDTESSRVLASSVFSNVQSDTLYVDYRVIENVGTLLVVNVPEPATATLSLMALAALAARRRRKV